MSQSDTIAVRGSRKTFARDLTIASAVGPAMALLASPVLARVFGVEGRGSIAAAVSAFLLLRWFATFGGQEAALRVSAERGTWPAASATVRWIGPISIITAVAAFWLAPYMFPRSPDAIDAFRVVVILLPLASVSDGLRFVLTGARQSSPVAQHIVAMPAIRLLGMLPLWLFSVTSIVVGAVVSIVGVLWGLVATIWPFRQDLRRLATRTAEEVEYRVLARRMAPGQLARLGNRRLDQLVLAALAGPSALGIYAVAVSVAEIPDFLTRAVRQIALTKQVEGDVNAAETAQVFRIGIVLWSAVAAALAIVTAPLLPLIFGSRFEGAVTPVLILLGAGAFAFVRDVLGADLVRADQPRLESAASIAGMIAGLLTLFILAPNGGATAAAWAAGVGYAVSAIMVSVMYFRAVDSATVAALVPRPADARSIRKGLSR